jgi:serine phosphatase RsbU (regulator of sigma subunit)
MANRLLHGRLPDGFTTCLVLLLEPNGACTPANAGHLPPFLHDKEIPLPPALPLGLIPQAEFETASLAVASGQRLTLYTDGLPEARNGSGDLYGFSRIAALLASQPNAAQIAVAAQNFGQDDDITVLTLAASAL